MYVLGIESSCDDTCAAVVVNGSDILSNVVSSQNEIHKKYGGVVPEVASRRHIEMIDIVIMEALERAGIGLDAIDVVSVTNRPGLIGSLLVGVGSAKAISYAAGIPLIAVNHLEAHLYSNLLENPKISGGFLGLIVSGGHSSIYLVDEKWNIKKVGHTVDDAAGEAFDKIARYLNLGYPGGPVIDRLAEGGDEKLIEFPRPMMESGDFNFSFSGLKTALIYRTKKDKRLMAESNMAHLVAGFQKAIVDVLIYKTIAAAKEFGISKVFISGGVAANSRLRKEFLIKGKENNIEVYIPPLYLCMDNASMVGCLGYHKFKKGLIDDTGIDVYSRSDF
ncbi:MAG TPA: tRNA (adenosine(37)-N6)-threonylcarbamoyltransferase complex transferase subunit TsaD [Actinobacteria bacterium]|nr:tRNA (adenosine(37)-N6)-threonylcarbamoyltransferase complex transferase subunit TsaD [Actinomycetota bacterium]